MIFTLYTPTLVCSGIEKKESLRKSCVYALVYATSYNHTNSYYSSFIEDTGKKGKGFHQHTVNVEIFSQYIFSRRALDERKFDVSKNYYYDRTNRINWYVRENLATRICLLMRDVRKFSCTKICTFTAVFVYGQIKEKVTGSNCQMIHSRL